MDIYELIRLRKSVRSFEGKDVPDEVVTRLLEAARKVPRYYRPDFYDGAAHGIPWPVDDLDECLDAIESTVPEQYRSYLYHGPILRLVRTYNGNPAEVLPRLQDVPEPMQAHIPNGLRIGLLLEYVPRWQEAIAVALQYPEEYQATIFEEFGWWMGEELGRDISKASELLAQLPERLRDDTCRGYIRGLDLSDDRETYRDIINALDPSCRDAARQALERKLQAWKEDARNVYK